MAIEDEVLDGSAARLAFRELFRRTGADNTRRILNILLESPFFYRDDDLDLFGVLRRQTPTFRNFFQEFYGWELYVDAWVARLVKPRTYNGALRPTQRHIFRLRGRQEYILFLLLLEFYHRQADEQNLDLDRTDEVRFVLSDFIQFVFLRYRDELGEQAPTEERILDWTRTLFDKLEQFRFIAVRQKEGIVADEGRGAGFTREGSSNLLYALLPGMRCYRPEALARNDFFASESSETDGSTEVIADEEEKPFSNTEDVPGAEVALPLDSKEENG